MNKWHQQVFTPAITPTKWLSVVGAFIILSLSLVLVSQGLPNASAANVALATDTFNRTVSNGWGTANKGGAWTVVDTAANWSVAPGAGSINVAANAQERGILGSVTVQNVDVLAKIILPRCSDAATNCDAYVMGRYSGGSTPTYYRIGPVQGASQQTVYLRSQRADGSTISNDINTGIAAASTVSLWIRVQFIGVNPTVIHARVWANGTTEPTSWLLNTTDTDSAEQIAGTVGVRARNEDAATNHSFQYRHYQVTGLTNGPTPSPTVTLTATGTPISGTVASDGFQRTLASGWGNADTGGWWTTVGSPWNWSVAPGAGSVAVTAKSQERAYLSTFTIQNTDIVEKIVLPRCTSGSANCDSYVLGRYTAAYTPTYYRVGLVQGASRSTMFLRAQRDDGTNIGGDINTGVAAANKAVVWLHVQFLGTNPTTLQARAWLDGTTEPTTWTLNVTDNNGAEQTAGMVGVRFSNEDGVKHIFQLESYQVNGTANPITVTPNPTGSSTAHWLYVVDDGMVSAYDIDHNHALVKQFALPEAGKRGVAMSPTRGLLYVSECGMNTCNGANGSLLAYDLVHDVVAWIANYGFGIDQMAVTPDGSTIYMPHGADASDGTHTVIDASDGKPLSSIQTGTNGHNTIVSLDGTQVYLNGYTGNNYNNAHVVNTATNQVILNAGPVVDGVRPFTVNGKHTLMFTTSTNTCGFQVLSLTTGKVIATITFSGSCSWTVSNAPSHGISLSPDEQRVYVMDAPLDQLEVYDVSKLPNAAPTFVKSVQLSSLNGYENPCQTYCEKEGWVLNDLSGRYVYVGDTGDVVDTSTLKSVMTLSSLQNTRQMIEVDWASGVTSATSTRFGLGRVIS